MLRALRPVASWRALFPDAEVIGELAVLEYPDVRSFLRSVQQAGATYSAGRLRFLSRDILQHMVRCYREQFPDAGSDGIVATYHVLYVYCTPPVG